MKNKYTFLKYHVWYFIYFLSHRIMIYSDAVLLSLERKLPELSKNKTDERENVN